jgi:hypothetical protein
MDDQRRAFLGRVEAELAVQPDSPAAVVPGRFARKAAAVAGLLFATASFFTLSAAGASASTETGNAVVAACPGPDPTPSTQYKGCGSTTQKFEYVGYYNPVPHIICYKFDAYMLTCNLWYPSGHPEACTH